MGKSMAVHLLNAGYSLVVYSRTKNKAQDLLEKGAEWSATPKEVAQKAAVTFTMVGYPTDVEEIYFGEDGLIRNGASGSYLIDMTTSSPSLATRIYDEAKKAGIQA